MANVKISALPTATTINAADLLPVVQGGVTKQVTSDLLPLSAATAAALAGKDASGAAAAAQATAVQRTNHTGTQSADTITDGTTNKAYTATERTKLASIAAGATANRADAAVDTLLAAKADLVGGLVPTAQIPALALNTAVTVASQAGMLALTASQVQPGDIAVRTDGAGTFILTAADPTILGNWTRLNAPTDAVTTVNGQTGTVVLSAANVGADAAGAAAAAVTGLAPLASPSFTGTPTIAGTAVAKTSDVTAAVAAQATTDAGTYLAKANGVLPIAGPGIDITGATDSTTAIQALLTGNPGKRFQAVPGAIYRVTSRLVCYTGQVLDMRAATVNLVGSANELLVNNAAINPQRTVTDAVTTATSTTITSATAAFTTADVGRSVTIGGAGPAAMPLAATITAVTNGTTAVLDYAASTATTAATLRIWTRDTNIIVAGGTWTRDATVSDTHLLKFRRVDGITIALDAVTTLHGKYGINFGHVTNFKASCSSLNTHSDGIHINGPAVGGTIDGVTGNTGDDCIALTGNDYVSYADVVGPISSISIDHISRTATSPGNHVKVLAGVGCPVRNISIDNVTGTSGAHLVTITDDSASANTVGSDVDGVTIGKVAGAAASGYALLQIAGAGLGTITADSLVMTSTSYGLLLGSTTAGLQLAVGKIATSTAGSSRMLQIDAGAAWRSLAIGSITAVLNASRANGRALNISSAGGPIDIGELVQTGGEILAYINPASGTLNLGIGTLRTSNIDYGVWLASGFTLNLALGTWVGSSPNNGPIMQTGTGAVLNAVVRGHMLTNGNMLNKSAGTARINGQTATAKVGDLTPNDGDIITNTDSGAACGVGAVVYNAAAGKWKNLYTGVTT